MGIFDNAGLVDYSYLNFNLGTLGAVTVEDPLDVDEIAFSLADRSLPADERSSHPWSAHLHLSDATWVGQSIIKEQSHVNPQYEITQTVNASSSSASRVQNMAGSGGILFALPLEVMYNILSRLTICELASTRLVCRSLAQIFKPEYVPTSFWRSQFTHDVEFDFLHLDTSQARNWRGLACSVKEALSNGNRLLLNRKWISQLLEHLAGQVELVVLGSWQLMGHRANLVESGRAIQSLDRQKPYFEGNVLGVHQFSISQDSAFDRWQVAKQT